MAIPAGWSAADWSGYLAAQSEPAEVRAAVTIHDLSGNLLTTVPAAGFLEGQFDIVSGDEAIDRIFRGTFYDVAGMLSPHLDPSVAPKRLIRVRQSIRTVTLGKWLHCYTFTGRPHVSNDAGAGVWSIEAQDKGTFHQRGVTATRFAKGANIVTAIRNYLTATGETQFNFPPTSEAPRALTADIKFGGAADQMTPLAAMRKAASQAGMQLYWTGAGVATLRKWPQVSEPLFTFDARLGHVQSVPEFATDMSSLRNRWTGGGKGSLWADVSATGTYSAADLAINGVPWSNIEFGDDNDSLGTRSELESVAKSKLNELLTLSAKATFNAVPFWVVDPFDVYEVATPERTEKFVLRDCSVPIAAQETAGGTPMSIGTHFNTRGGGAGPVRSGGAARKAKKKSKRKGKRR